LHSRYSDWLQTGWSGDRIPVGARFPAPVQTGPGAHPASCTMGTGSFPGVKSSWCVTLTPHPLLVSWSRKSRAIPLLPLWVVRPVQSLSACTRVHFTLPKYMKSGHWVVVSYTQDKRWLQIKTFSNEQSLKCPHYFKTPQEGVLTTICSKDVSSNARVAQDLVIMSRTYLMGFEYGQ